MLAVRVRTRREEGCKLQTRQCDVPELHMDRTHTDPAPSSMIAVVRPRRVLGDQDDDDQRKQRQGYHP